MTSEVHLFVLWDRVGPSRETVLHRIGSEFVILRVLRIRWSPSLFSINLSRFYGQNLPVGCNKEESCGTGPFTLIVVRDDRPDYAIRETTRATARVNTRTFDLKAFFRSPQGGNLPVHATDTLREARHDLALLLGVGPDAFVAANPGTWNGDIIPLRQDIAGAHGWERLSDLFTVLNEAIDYVVLRNFECLPDQFHLENHGDIDLLVGDYFDACLVANATPVLREAHRVHCTVVIAGEAIPFDFRYVGDDYYDESWQRQILNSRQLTDRGLFVPDIENHFYSLLYHAAVHKQFIAPDYSARLAILAESLGVQIDPKTLLRNPKRVRTILRDYMRSYGYRFTRPHDPTVVFNRANALGPVQRIVERLLPQNERSKPIPPTPPSLPPVPSASDQHLTNLARANLLRCLRFEPSQRILELGCDGGVITRYLGECGAEVVAVESVPTLAALAEERCADLPNIRIICDDLITAGIDGDFDVVTLIGAPEHIAVCNEAGDTLGTFIERAASLLKNDGLLILAINNQLGLKYFNGCSEDRTGMPYFGINNLYSPGDPRSIGRLALSERLLEAGFSSQQFLFPFPDYKVPTLILSEAALHDAQLNITDLLIHNTGRSYPETHHRAFAEDRAWGVVAENGLLADLANSFLVLAQRVEPTSPRTEWLAKMYSRGSRHPLYQVEATITKEDGGALCVKKRKIFPLVPPEQEWMRHVVADSTYLSGNLLVGNIRKAMAREASLEELCACFAPWLKFLLANAIRGEAELNFLPGHFVDCIPSNLIVAPSGGLTYFDAEWVTHDPIPFAWVVIRGIAYSVIDCLDNRSIRSMTYREFISDIAKKSGVILNASDFATADLWEARLVAQCHADATRKPRLSEYLDASLFLTARLMNQAPDYRHSLAWHQDELARVKRTVSWRITAPMRVIWNAYLKVTGKNHRNDRGGL